jgi:hypothetical protein
MPHPARPSAGSTATAGSPAPQPLGPGRIPGITPAQLRWSEAEIAGYLATGFTPSFDTAGGTMGH